MAVLNSALLKTLPIPCPRVMVPREKVKKYLRKKIGVGGMLTLLGAFNFAQNSLFWQILCVLEGRGAGTCTDVGKHTLLHLTWRST